MSLNKLILFNEIKIKLLLHNFKSEVIESRKDK